MHEWFISMESVCGRLCRVIVWKDKVLIFLSMHKVFEKYVYFTDASASCLRRRMKFSEGGVQF